MTQQLHSYCHRGGDEPLLGATIPEHFAAVTARFEEHEAITQTPDLPRTDCADWAGHVQAIECKRE